MQFTARISGSVIRKPVAFADSHKEKYDFIPSIVQDIIYSDDQGLFFDININGYDVSRVKILPEMTADGREEEEYDDVAMQVVVCIEDYIFASQTMKSFDFLDEDIDDAVRVLECIKSGDWSEY